MILNGLFAKARLVLVILAFLILSGGVSYYSISKENSPDVRIPLIYVSLSLDGISPGDSERLLVRPVETAVSGIAGVKKITANAYQGGGNVLLEFVAGYDLSKAYDDVDKEVSNIRNDLPSDANEPRVSEVNLSDEPIIKMNLRGNVSEEVLIRTARRLKKFVRTIPSVLDVELNGDREEIIEIIIKPEVLENYNITPTQVSQVFQKYNSLIVAGEQSDKASGAFKIRVPGTFENAEDIINLPIVTIGEEQIRLRDIATYTARFEKPKVLTRLNGANTVTLDITKRSGTNLLETIQKVRILADRAKQELPEGVEIVLSYDTSKDIKSMLSNLQNSILSAITLIMIIIVGALGFRSGLLVGISIPASFLSGIVVLYLSGITLNVVVLFGLILAVGMLVDGAIVVVEYAQRKRAEGLTPEASFKAAIRKMGMPIISSTATTLAAFIPLIFWPGVAGEFMKYIPLTLIAVLSTSLFVALLFMPVLGAYFNTVLRIIIRLIIIVVPTTIGGTSLGLIGAIIGATVGLISGHFLLKKLAKRLSDSANNSEEEEIIRFDGRYARILKKCLHYPKTVLISSGVLLVASWGLYIAFGSGMTFFPDSEPTTFRVNVHSPGSLSLKEKDNLTRKVERIILGMSNENQEIQSISTKSGSVSGSRALREDKIGVVAVELVDWSVRRTYKEIKTDLMNRLKEVEGIEIRISATQGGPKSEKPIEIILEGVNRQDLRMSMMKIRKLMERKGYFEEIDDTISAEGVDFEFIPDRIKAASYGVDLQTLGATIRLVTSGVKVGSFRPDYTDTEVSVYVKYPEKYRTLSGLEELRIQTTDGSVPFSEIVERKPTRKLSKLSRRDSLPSETLKSNVTDKVVANTVLTELVKEIKDSKMLAEGVILRLGGDKEEQMEAQSFLGKAFAVAIFLMAVILLAQFNSFYQTFLVLVAVIMSTVGVMLGLLITSTPFSIVMSGVAVIALAGIVVNNNIVLIDTFKYRQTVDKNTYDAIMHTSISRLRPVLLTSLTTGLGLLPTALGVEFDFVKRTISFDAPGSAIWQLLSQNILFGLVFASVLTLLVTPCALYVFYANEEKKNIGS